MQAWWSTRITWEESSFGRAAPWGSLVCTSCSRARAKSSSSPVCSSLAELWGWSDISSSVSTRRQRSTLSLRVRTTIPGSARRTQEAASTRAPSTSTTHRRHTPAGASFGSWHRAGTSTPAARAASKSVAPSATRTSRPSMLSVTLTGPLRRRAGGSARGRSAPG